MKTQLIILDTPIIVSDEEIREGDYILTDKNITGKVIKVSDNGIGIEIKIIRKDNNLEYYPLTCKKIIAGIEGLPSIDWDGLEEFGWIDIEKLSKADIKFHHKNIQKREIDYILGYEDGFKRAQSLNEKKFSLKDIEGFIDYMYSHKTAHKYKDGYGDFQVFTDLMRQYIQSLQQPKIFDIEVEMEEYGLCIPCNKQGVRHCAHPEECSSSQTLYRPKITNRSIKILRKL